MSSMIWLIFLSVVQTILGTEDQGLCPKNRSLFEIPGNAVLSGKAKLVSLVVCTCVLVR